jgi:hypothetical protein
MWRQRSGARIRSFLDCLLSPCPSWTASYVNAPGNIAPKSGNVRALFIFQAEMEGRAFTSESDLYSANRVPGYLTIRYEAVVAPEFGQIGVPRIFATLIVRPLLRQVEVPPARLL